MESDRSEGWDAVAQQFIVARSAIGAGLVRAWARDTLSPGATILDLGCGTGVPIAQALIEDGFALFAIDASPALLAAFRRRFPDVQAACEAAQDSAFFQRRFDAVIAIGLLFLLSAEDQRALIGRVAAALTPGAHFLFTAPAEPATWPDSLTGRPSHSLGQAAYRRLLDAAGLRLVRCHRDEGGNHYFDAVRPVIQPPEPDSGGRLSG